MPIPVKPARRSAALKWIIGLIAVVLVVIGAASVVIVTRLVSAADETKSLAAEIDSFIAREYPDYTVVQREPFSNYYNVAGPGADYFLERKGNPDFVLLVSVCNPPKMTPEILELKLVPNGDYLTTDGVFSQSMLKGSWVNDAVVSAIVQQYVLAKPATHAVIARTAMAEDVVYVGIASDIRYDPKLGYMSPLNPTKLGIAKLDGPADDARPLISFTVSDISSE